MFYAVSDDIDSAKELLKEKIGSDFYIKFPGTGHTDSPGTHLTKILIKLLGSFYFTKI